MLSLLNAVGELLMSKSFMADGKQVNGWRKISNRWQLTGELLENNYFQLGGSEPANNLKKKNCFKGLVVNCLL